MPATRTPTRKADENVFTKEERAAVQAAARERKAAAGRSPEEEREAGLQDLKASLAKMPADDRAMGERIHRIVSDAVPDLMPKTYYGMPAYAMPGKDGRTICWYKAKSKFKVRYSTFGFQPDAHLDDGKMWPTEFAVIELTPEVERRLATLVKQAAS
jgi:uncharacterized protein YdhG (YjbR/CyaY superfamily)